MNTQSMNELKQRVIARAQQDETFRQALLQNPRAAIEQLTGQPLPQDFSFDPSSELELTSDELAKVAGGGRKL